MADELQAGAAYVQVLPSMRGYHRRVQAEVGTRAVTQSIEPRVDPAALAKARTQMEAAAAKVAEARRKEADAAGAVRTAEAALTEVRERGGVKASQIVAAEERVAAARRRSEAAAQALARAEASGRSTSGRVERLEIRADSSKADAEVRQFTARTEGEMRDLGGKAAVAATAGLAAAGAALGASLVGAINVEAAQGKLRAQLGLTEAESARVGAVAGGLFRDAYGGSLEEVNTAVGAVISSLDGMRTASTETVEAASRRALDFASTFDVDVARAVKSVGVLLSTGLAGDATEAFDLVTAAAQQVPAAMREDLLEASDEYGQFFATLGFSGEQAFALLTDAAGKGQFELDKVGDAAKEFTIRSTDMSAASREAYSAIGLDAQTMANRILAGGQSAQGATQQIIDGLLGITDPSEQAAAAVALFGTPLEDLNVAEIPAFLQSMQGASGAMEDWRGSSDRMGESLNDNAATNIESFKRSLSGAFVDMLGGKVLPILTGVGSFLATVFGPALRATAGFIRDNSAWLGPLAVGVGGFAAAVGLANLAMSLWAARTAVAAAAQWALNLAMSANPIGLILALLVGLAAGLVFAYQRSETFRNIVQGAWAGIQAAVMFAWTNVLKPVFDGFMAALRFVGEVATWLWTNVLSPVFGFIGTAAKILALVVIGVMITPTVLAFRALAAVGMWLWTNALQPAFAGIGAAAMWLYNNAILPAWRGIQTAISFAWNNVIAPIWRGLVAYIQGVIIPVALFLWRNVIEPAFRGIGAVISTVWTSVVQPVFGALRGGLDLLGDGFRATVEFIGRMWNRLKAIAAAPVNFVIREVYNRGIKAAWDKIAGWVGLPKLPVANEIRFATGGFAEGPHVAQIARGGAMRVWAEPETGGEAYIPLAASKRTRSTGILSAVADRFGLQVLPRGPAELALFADGGLWRNMWGVVSGQFPRARRTSTYRPGDRGFHGSGRAVDIAGPTAAPRGSAFMAGVNRWLAQNFANSSELIYTPGTNLKNGRPDSYNAATRAQHYNHVHWALANAGMLSGAKGSADGAGGGAFDPIGFLRGLFGDAFDKVGQVKARFGESPIVESISRFPSKVIDNVIGWGKDKVGGWFGRMNDTIVRGVSLARWAPLVTQMLALVGQPLSHVGVTLRRMNQESGGNPRAINDWDVNARRGTPSKGLMQVIAPTFRAYRHRGLPNDVWNPASNIAASMRYALAIYGSLPAAYNRPGGYDAGGLASGRGIMFKDVIAPERVLSARQTAAFEDLVPLLATGPGMSPAQLAALQATARDTPTELTGALYLDSGQFLGHVRGQVGAELDTAQTTLAFRRRT